MTTEEKTRLAQLDELTPEEVTEFALIGLELYEEVIFLGVLYDLLDMKQVGESISVKAYTLLDKYSDTTLENELAKCHHRAEVRISEAITEADGLE